MTALFVPLSLAAAGIVLRGAAFVFRKTVQELAGRRLLGATFALSSVVTPFFLGAALGAIVSGRVRVGDPGGEPRWLSAWTSPTSLLIGALAVLCAAFLAAVFLVFDARRAGDEALERYFRRRAIGSAVVTGLLAIAGVYVLRSDAPFLFHRLARQGLSFVFFSAASGVGCLTLMASGITSSIRGLAIGAVVAVLAGWGVAQYPYLLPTSLTIAAGAGAPATLTWVVVVFLVATVTALPALAFLFILDQRGRLEEDAAVTGRRRERRRRDAVVEGGSRPPGVRPSFKSPLDSRT
jgi:cytochrome d ubiquinol oxidase subunit II